MRSKAGAISDGLVQELIPLLKNGFVILRSILDILIERIEEIEKSRDTDVRKDIYTSIIDALETEADNIRKEETDTASAEAKMQVLDAVISVLTNEISELESMSKKKGKKPQKVKID